jgi:hypothetical protein
MKIFQKKSVVVENKNKESRVFSKWEELEREELMAFEIWPLITSPSSMPA